MILENKLGITSSPELAEEKISILKKEIGRVVDWSLVDKKDYLLAMERSPIRDIEIKHILKADLTDKIYDCEIYMKGIDHSYYYEGYLHSKQKNYKLKELMYAKKLHRFFFWQKIWVFAKSYGLCTLKRKYIMEWQVKGDVFEKILLKACDI